MEASSGNHCVRPFNHLPFLVGTTGGGLVAFFIAIAITNANVVGKFILFVLFLGAFGGMIYSHYRHIKFYNHHNSEYFYRPGKRDYYFAMGLQIFISACWAIFSLSVIAAFDPLISPVVENVIDFGRSLPELLSKRPIP